MNCIIPSQNTKVLGKAINSLVKIGDELFMEMTRDKLILVTLNMSRTICAQCTLLESFFSSYEVEEKILKSKQTDTLTCKLFMKTLLPLFKGNLEKKLDFLKIEYEDESDFIYFKMKYKHDHIMMTHKLRLMDTETLSINLTPNNGINNLCGSSNFFNSVLTMFNPSDPTITLEITKLNVIAKNYCPGAALRNKLMRCEVKLHSGEFVHYDVVKETTINFALKPLRTIISIADAFNFNLAINFDVGSKPLTLMLKNSVMEMNFLVSTLDPSQDLSSTLASTSLPTIKRLSNANVSSLNCSMEKRRRDIELLNINEGNAAKKKKLERTYTSSLVNNFDSSGMESEVNFSLDTTTRQRLDHVFGKSWPSLRDLGMVLCPDSDSE